MLYRFQQDSNSHCSTYCILHPHMLIIRCFGLTNTRMKEFASFQFKSWYLNWKLNWYLNWSDMKRFLVLIKNAFWEMKWSTKVNEKPINCFRIFFVSKANKTSKLCDKALSGRHSNFALKIQIQKWSVFDNLNS